MIVAFDWRRWVVGLWWDYDCLGLDIGPLGFEWPALDERYAWMCQSWRLGQIVVGKLEIRLEADSNLWLIGYAMAAPWDHGLYLGLLNVQIEYAG